MKILGQQVSRQVVVFIVADAALSVVSFTASVWLAAILDFAVVELEFLAVLRAAFLYTAVLLFSLMTMGLFSSYQRYRIEAAIARVVVAIFLAAIVIALADFFFDLIGASRLWLLALSLNLVILSTARIVYQSIANDDVFKRRVIVYGAGFRAANILDLRRQSDQRGYSIVAFVPISGESVEIDDHRVVREPPQSLLRFARENEVSEIVVAVDDRRRNFPLAELLECKFGGLRILDIVEFLERETGRVKVSMVNPSWFIFSGGFSSIGGVSMGFRLFDILACLAALIFAIPISIVVAAAIALTDGFPILYRQRRVGLNSKEFTLLKFRSMRRDAESSGSAVWAQAEDERATRVGGFLRKSRLDELPQLINVLLGDMSFVGPRPERPEFVAQLAKKIPYYHERHCVKPGLTGWAQLGYPYGASEQDALAKLEYDMYYIKNRSLIFNLVILLQTVEVVIWRKGAR